MRFTEDGPDIPGELLEARDEGQVIFFCGSGVSRHKAGGLDFAGLARRVVETLGSLEGSPARRLLALSADMPPIPGMGGVVAAARVFALLEQEFDKRDVRRAVAEAVQPPRDAPLDAHRVMIDLSRAPDGAVRLVTTNFDLLFRDTAPGVDVWTPPLLPDPSRAIPFSGVVHLHGKVSSDYRGVDGDEFVVSSADFGRAYLADGWATRFMRSLMERFRIVFLGYSADDPPVQYLLEALGPAMAAGRMYAFQLGDAAQAGGLWRHKGVTAIPFSGFDALWTSLERWAARARDPDAWRREVAGMAARGPRALCPYERGQVAHLVSSNVGAAAFAEADGPAPAEWLCAFDPAVRFSTPRRSFARPDADIGDPFDSYGLDGDLPPTFTRENDPDSGRAVPLGAWSAVDWRVGDGYPGFANSGSGLRGPGSVESRRLPSRLHRLVGWFRRVAREPMAIWWAAGQHALHPDVRRSIENAIEADGFEPEVKRVWRLLLDAKERPSSGLDLDHGPYLAAMRVRNDGWSNAALRQLAHAARPVLTVDRASQAAPTGAVERLRDLVRVDVAYPNPPMDVEVPEDWVAPHLKMLRRQLELAVELETEAHETPFYMLRPLNPFDVAPNEFVHHHDDLSTLIARLVGQMRRLVALDVPAARREVAAWPAPTNAVFAQLAIWAAGQRELTSPGDAARSLGDLPTDLFWERHLERDLLTTLEARWIDLDEADRRTIELRLLAGEGAWVGVDAEQTAKHRAWGALVRLHWIERTGLAVSFDLAREIAVRRAVVPEWTPVEAADQLDQSSSRGGYVRTETEHEALRRVPPAELLEAAAALSGRGRDHLVENRPFKGLVETKPVLCLAALRMAAASGDDARRAWSDFLWSEARAKDGGRLRLLTAERLARLPESVLRANLQSACYWLAQRGERLWREHRRAYLKLWDRLSATIAAAPESDSSALVRRGEPDWVTAAINSPSGRLAEALHDELGWSGGTPEHLEPDWLVRAEALLSMRGEPKAHVAAVFGMRLRFYHHVERAWTERWLLPLLEGDLAEDATRAVIAGFLGHAGMDRELFARVRGLMLRLLSSPTGADRRYRRVAGMLLAGWATRDDAGDRLVASGDLRHALVHAADEDRVAALHQVARWAGTGEGDWSGERLPFLREVWPRQLAARNPQTISALADLALNAGDDTPAVTEAVLPLLAPIAGAGPTGLRWLHSKDDSVERHPGQHLAVLSAILPDRAAEWPYGMVQLIGKLATIPAVANDGRLIELRRRVAAG